jgi:hypothetical protein
MERPARIAVLLSFALLARPGLVSAQSTGARAGQPDSATAVLVLVKEKVTPRQYHRSGCELIRDGKGVLAMTRAQAESRGYTAHRDCDPSMAPGKQPDPAGGRSAAPAPEPNVVIDAAGKYYHRDTCSRIGASPRKVALKDAGKRWPCPSCRPPVRKPVEAPLVPRWKG